MDLYFNLVIFMNINSILLIIGSNILTHFILFGFNNFKGNTDSPFLYKIISFFTVYTINIILFTIFIFYQKIFTNLSLIVYIGITTILFIIHFILDDDNLFRFEKSVVLAIMIPLVVIIYLAILILLF